MSNGRFSGIFLEAAKVYFGGLSHSNIFRMSSIVSAPMQGDKNESMSSHNLALQCEPQILYYLLLGTGPINCVNLARIQVSKIGIISTLSRFEKSVVDNIQKRNSKIAEMYYIRITDLIITKLIGNT